MRAARAPANPLAPATRTLGLLTERAPDAPQGVTNPLPDRGDLLVGESPAGGAEFKPDREAFAARAHLLAAEEVEDLRAVEELATRGNDGLADTLGRDVFGNDDGDVLKQR